MSPRDAETLATAIHVGDLLVGYQSDVWLDRDFDGFRATWARLNVDRHPTGLRVLERYAFVAGETKNPHLEIVELALRRWLPKLLPQATPLGERGWIRQLELARASASASASAPGLDPLVAAAR
jgi:hypothetical protein